MINLRISVVIDSNNKIIRQGECLNDKHNPYNDGVVIETDIEDLVGIYKLIDSQLVELTEEEKQIDICLDDLKQQKVKDSKIQLELWLTNNPLFSTIHNPNGEYYNVTQDKQAQLTQMIILAQGNPLFTPIWNNTGGLHEVWTLDELLRLAYEISQYVSPRVKKQQEYEIQIKSRNTVEEVEKLMVDYATV